MKTANMLCLVTDSNRAMDMPPGRYAFGHEDDQAWFDSDGLVGRGLDGGLASALKGMDHGVRLMATSTRVPLHEIVRMASLTPAERTGIDRHVGSIAVGKSADLLVLNQDLEITDCQIGRGIPPS
jgi:N-acetylglucosamine-6-phosphate deacetylase